MERENNDGQINDVDSCKDEIYKTVEQKKYVQLLANKFPELDFAIIFQETMREEREEYFYAEWTSIKNVMK